MILNKENILNGSIANKQVEQLFNLPEKVLQFGTGVLLRGLPDFFIDNANKNNLFNGRVVIVKSTDKGDTTAFDKQDGLFTICDRGLQNGEQINSNTINASISRVLSATQHWDAILQCAHNAQMQIIISNTTEVGIQFNEADVENNIPVSFPARVLAFLQERYNAFGGSKESGMIILPTELISNNGTTLKDIVLKLASLKKMNDAFISWIKESNHFCNTLVDRIVPGKPSAEMQTEIEATLGYKDELMIMAEPFKLWVIEGNESLCNILSFVNKEEGCFLVDDLNIYKELKLRLLNATHTLSCGLAHLAGIDTVSNAMHNNEFKQFVNNLLYNEIAISIPYKINDEVIQQFASRVVERFSNTFIKHNWINITMQYSLKMKMRCIALLKQYVANNNAIPENFALGFAAYLLFMKTTKKDGNKYYGFENGKEYEITDSEAEYYYNLWKDNDANSVVKIALANAPLWGEDLNSVSGFACAITEKLNLLISVGALATLYNHLSPKELVTN